MRPRRGWEEGRVWVIWTLSLYSPGPLIATFATLLLYGPWVVPRECLSPGGTNE